MIKVNLLNRHWVLRHHNNFYREVYSIGTKLKIVAPSSVFVYIKRLINDG